MSTYPIPISADPAIHAATVMFRHAGVLYVTAIIKATFRFVPSGIAAPTTPLPIEVDERSRGALPVMGIDAASDLAPYVPGVGVTFSGHAFAPRGQETSACSVRLALYRDRTALLEKTLHIFGEARPDGSRKPFAQMALTYDRALGGPGTNNPAGTATPTIVYPDSAEKAAGFGPISKHWPDRKRLLSADARSGLAKPILELPDQMPWEYFQSAPIDQRIASLAGGEWLVLDGLHATEARMQTQIPSLRPAARLYEQAAPETARGQAFELAADTLILDGEKELLSILWRGRLPITKGEPALSGLVVVAGIESSDKPIPWTALRAAAKNKESPEIASRSSGSSAGEETLATTGISDAKAIPFASQGPGARAASAEATPFAQIGNARRALKPAPLPSAVEGTIATSTSGEAERTLAASPASGSRPITPFAPSANAQPEPPSTHGAASTSPIPGAPFHRPEPVLTPAPAFIPAPASAHAPSQATRAPRRIPAMLSAPKPTAPKPKPAPPLAKDAAGLASRLENAGVPEAQIKHLVESLRPTLAPPEEE